MGMVVSSRRNNMANPLGELTKKLLRLSAEKALYNSLKSVAGDLPKEALDELYHGLYRPVMLIAYKRLYEAMWGGKR